MNLHAIANKHVRKINPNEPCLLFKSLGQTNVKGQLFPLHAKGVEANLQIQSESADRINNFGENIDSLEPTRKAWINASPGLAPINRPKAAGGDIVQRMDGTWWLVTAMLEEFSDWSGVRLTLQVEPPVVESDD